MNDKGTIAPYLASSSVTLFKPENKSQFKTLKDPNSIRMRNFWISTGIPFTLYSNMLTFRGSNKSFKLDGDFLETMKNFDFNVSPSSPQDQIIIFESGKEMNSNKKQKGRKSPRDKLLKKLLNSPVIMASRNSTMFLAADSNELCDRLNVLSQEKQAGNNSDLINEEIFAIVDVLLG